MHTYSGTHARACKGCARALWSMLITRKQFSCVHCYVQHTHSDTHLRKHCGTHTHCLSPLYYVLNMLPVYTHIQSLCYTREHVQCSLWARTCLWYTDVCQHIHAQSMHAPIHMPWHTQTQAPWFTLRCTHTLMPSGCITLLEADPQPEISLHV